MSRIAKAPVELPQGTEFKQDGDVVTIKGSKGVLSHQLNSEVELTHEDGVLKLAPRSGSRFATAVTGTTRSLLANMVTGVTEGFERKLEIVGVGYRVQAKGSTLEFALGYSHPIVVEAPDGRFVSYCGMWYEPVHSIAYVEPVATDPDYRRMGLGRAAVMEGIRRCGALGATEAWVGSDLDEEDVFDTSWGDDTAVFSISKSF